MSSELVTSGDHGLEEGRCERCGKLVTRKPGSLWRDQYGRDRCRADPDDGQCQVTKARPYAEPRPEPVKLVKPPKPPVLARGNGSVTHNRDGRPGKLEVTVWGRRKNGRQAGIVLDEEAVRRMLQHLAAYDLLPRTWKQRRKRTDGHL